jgi:branched-chain amino acid transport system substrate-binding protein
MKFILLAFACILLSSPAYAEIRIAVAAPLSGEVAALGEEIRSGADAAVADINAKGGVLGQQIILQYYDDSCNATQAATVANKITIDFPVGIIGHLCSATTLAAANTYGEAGIPQIAFSSNVQVTQSGYRHLFRLMGRDDNQTADLATYMSHSLKSTDKIAVLDDKGSWGMGFADKLTEQLPTHKLTVGLRDSVSQGQKDFSSLITRLKKEGITAVGLGLQTMEAGLLIRQAREQGFEGAFFGGDPILSPEFWRIAGRAAEGVRLTGPYEPRKTEQGKNLKQRLTHDHKAIGAYNYYAYAAVQVYAQAITKAGAPNSTALLQTMREATFDTVLGPIRFDARGDLIDFHYQIFIWHDGETLQATNP